MFLLFFENFAMSGEKEAEKALELPDYLVEKDFEFFLAQVMRNGELTGQGSGYTKVKQALIAEFVENGEQQEAICKVIVATPDQASLVASKNATNTLFSEAEFIEKGKFGLLRYCVMRVKDLCCSSMYCKALISYEDLMRDTRDFKSVKKAFRSAKVLS